LQAASDRLFTIPDRRWSLLSQPPKVTVAVTAGIPDPPIGVREGVGELVAWLRDRVPAVAR
jgi:hypothetical protein